MITITPYELEEDRGTIKRGRKNVLRVDVEPPENAVPFGNREEYDTYQQTRGMVLQRELAVVDSEGEVDAEATEAAIESHYSEYYQRLMDLAVDWAVGMECKKGQAAPIRYDGKLYDVIQSHTTQSDWTPDVVPALYIETPAPAASGYPVWYQPQGGHDAWALGSRCEWPEGGQVWESTVPDNVWEPGVYGWVAI